MAALHKMPPIRHLTVAEFLAWPSDQTGCAWQLIDGEPVAMAPASDTHGAIQAEIAALIRNHLLSRNSPCRVVVAPGVSPRIRANTNVRVPDLAVTCQPASLKRHLMEQPVLAIEILSPSNEAETWGSVLAYATIPSMRDILVVRSLEVGAEVLTRQPDGTWPAEFTQVSGRLLLPSIEAEFDVADFYATTEFARPAAR